MLNRVLVNVLQGCLENLNVLVTRWRRVMLAVRDRPGKQKNDSTLSDF